MAVPIKAKDEVPMITNFNIVVSCCPLAPSGLTTNPNHYHETISRAQPSDRTLSFFDGCCRNNTHFRGLGAASLREAARSRSTPNQLQKSNGKIRPVRAT